MHKKLVLFISLLFLYLIIQILFIVFKHKYEIEYTITVDKEKFKIIEDYNHKIDNNYFITITHNDKVYSYQWQENYLGKKVINDIKYYKENNMECILPLFNDNIIFDLTCDNANNLMYYHNMERKNNIDEFLKEIKQYNKNIFQDDEIPEKRDLLSLYTNNIKSRFTIETYKGIINIENKKVNELPIFDNDVYKKELGVFTNNYYVVPDYSTTYEFNKIYIVDLNSNEIKTINLEKPISFDSYIQGIDNDIIYLFDLENKRQYRIEPNDLYIERIGNITTNINVYIDGKWSKENVSEVINDKPLFDFQNIRTKIDNTTYMDSVNNYIYTFKKKNNYYEVYKSNKYTPNIKNYLFYIDNIDNIKYIDDKIYFKRDNYIEYYSEKEGIKKVIQSNELHFNTNIKFTTT